MHLFLPIMLFGNYVVKCETCVQSKLKEEKVQVCLKVLMLIVLEHV